MLSAWSPAPLKRLNTRYTPLNKSTRISKVGSSSIFRTLSKQILSKIKTWRRKITLLKLQPWFIEPTKMLNHKQAKTYMLITSQEIRKYEEEKMQKKTRECKKYMQIYNNFTRATQILLTQPLAAWLYLSVLLKISNYVLCNNQVFPDKSMSREGLHLLRLTGWACCLSCGLCSVGTLELYTLVCTSNTKY